MLKFLLPVLALAAGLASPGHAQSSRAAALAQLKAEFAASDLDHDGVLTPREVLARMDAMKLAGAGHRLTPLQAKRLAALWFEHSDANHDGKVTLAESEATMMQVFDRYDTNHDGVISPAERAAAAELRTRR